MFFRLSKILSALFMVFLLAIAGSLIGLKHLYPDDGTGNAMVKADSTVLDPGPESMHQALPISHFTGEDEKDNSSSLNSVNLIIYMIYKVTNKSVE